ncbi:ornithine cyclodeaminase family protein [Myxococcus xanthus]|uniref:Putative alanine dehydrogenase n=1 Tax=Myxococcus xanthus TaxID=34 RepID=A0AAE6G7B8_MYXXA|nr:ornithine cyclodeaminase family protein [Myxococcus xanthus]QDE72183.1 ornithine cyclodeaminase family protein [Myxococcus xanthus]QDE79465.1 ornithine cyclodeaminase family protein [Myxococcus xanthus]QDF08843.1 ornithine cyclodeaminase family protein [Myxococcus xanthus]
MPTLILSAKDLRSLYTVELGLTAVERAFRAHGLGESLMPPKVYLSLPSYDGDFRAMPAFLDGAAGVKWVNAHPRNPEKHGLPTVRALYILSDPDTASPLAILDGTLLTAWRTGAAGGVASRFLAKKQPRTLGLVGCGVQARVLIDSHRALFGDLELLLADASEAAAKALQAEKGGRIVSTQEACAADIVCTATPARVPVVKREWFQPGAHINAMGADAPGKQELDARLLTEGRVFIDDTEQALHSGEVNVPLHDGLLRPEQIAGTLGEVVSGKKPGRTSDTELTVFDSTGLALQDVALARALYDAALKRGLGQPFDIVGNG